MHKRFIFIILILAAATLSGCSHSDSRHAVSGTVSLDSNPIESGMINFRPVAGVRGNSSGGTINDGNFVIDADKGLPPGKYVVTILTYKPTGRTVRDPQRGDMPELAPVKFHEANLEATISTDGPNRFDFNLTSIR